MLKFEGKYSMNRNIITLLKNILAGIFLVPVIFINLLIPAFNDSGFHAKNISEIKYILMFHIGTIGLAYILTYFLFKKFSSKNLNLTLFKSLHFISLIVVLTAILLTSMISFYPDASIFNHPFVKYVDNKTMEITFNNQDRKYKRFESRLEQGQFEMAYRIVGGDKDISLYFDTNMGAILKYMDNENKLIQELVPLDYEMVSIEIGKEDIKGFFDKTIIDSVKYGEIRIIEANWNRYLYLPQKQKAYSLYIGHYSNKSLEKAAKNYEFPIDKDRDSKHLGIIFFNDLK